MMSHVSVLYGATVRTYDLVGAGLAYAQLEPVYRAMELVSLRRQKGTLVTADGTAGAVGRVPDEVWGMIKKWIARFAVQDARVELMEATKCETCYAEVSRIDYNWINHSQPGRCQHPNNLVPTPSQLITFSNHRQVIKCLSRVPQLVFWRAELSLSLV